MKAFLDMPTHAEHGRLFQELGRHESQILCSVQMAPLMGSISQHPACAAALYPSRSGSGCIMTLLHPRQLCAAAPLRLSCWGLGPAAAAAAARIGYTPAPRQKPSCFRHSHHGLQTLPIPVTERLACLTASSPTATWRGNAMQDLKFPSGAQRSSNVWHTQ